MSKTVSTALRGGQPEIRQKIYESEGIDSELPWLDKGQFSHESYAEYSSCIYASLLGKPRLSFSPHVAELMNLSRIGSKGIADEEEDSSGEEPKVASGVADIPRSVSPRPADEPQSTDETNSTELDTSYSTRSLDESHSTMNTAVSDLQLSSSCHDDSDERQESQDVLDCSQFEQNILSESFRRSSDDWRSSDESFGPADPSIFNDCSSMTNLRRLLSMDMSDYCEPGDRQHRRSSLSTFMSVDEEMHQFMVSIESSEHIVDDLGLDLDFD